MRQWKYFLSTCRMYVWCSRYLYTRQQRERVVYLIFNALCMYMSGCCGNETSYLVENISIMWLLRYAIFSPLWMKIYTFLCIQSLADPGRQMGRSPPWVSIYLKMPCLPIGNLSFLKFLLHNIYCSKSNGKSCYQHPERNRTPYVLLIGRSFEVSQMIYFEKFLEVIISKQIINISRN